MGDMKSKLPDFEELTHMAGKLFKDVKKSVTEIAAAYKEKRESAEAPKEEAPAAKPKQPAAKAKKPEEPPQAPEPPETPETPEVKAEDDEPPKTE